jgi:toxin ParE1/3/4
VAHIEITPEAYDDFDRFLDHMERFEVADRVARIAQIIAELQILRRNPRIGRRVDGDQRELVIGQGARGYIALYRFVPRTGAIIVVAIRSQREGGYRRNG